MTQYVTAARKVTAQLFMRSSEKRQLSDKKIQNYSRQLHFQIMPEKLPLAIDIDGFGSVEFWSQYSDSTETDEFEWFVD